jgi:RimJ/RimL family protein N-acetyltransferase
MITLTPFTERHFATLLRWFPTEAALIQWAGPDVRFPLDAAQLQAMCDEGRGERPRRKLWMAIQEDAFIGHAQLAYEWRHGVARIARFCVAPEWRGKGLATPFLRQVIAEGFAHPEISRVELNVYTFNAAAIRTYENAGFIREGIRRQAVRVGDERWDTAMFGLLRDEHETYVTAG